MVFFSFLNYKTPIDILIICVLNYHSWHPLHILAQGTTLFEFQLSTAYSQVNNLIKQQAAEFDQFVQQVKTVRRMKPIFITFVLAVSVYAGKPRQNPYYKKNPKQRDQKYWKNNQSKEKNNQSREKNNQSREKNNQSREKRKYYGYKPQQWQKHRYEYNQHPKVKKQGKYFAEKKPVKLEVEKVPEQTYPQKTCDIKPDYDSNILVLVWPVQYCQETKDCSQQWQSLWDEQSLILKGFWPSGSDEYFYDCFILQSDENCQQDAFEPDFELQQFLANQTALIQKIRNFWDPYHLEEGQEVYRQEWLKHGMCYLMNIIEDNYKAYETDPEAFNRTILIEYFKNGIEKLRKLNLYLQSGEQYTFKKQFASVIGFSGKEDHFNLICGDDNEIDEVHICYNRTKIPGKETTIPCPPYDSCERHPKFRVK